MSASRPVIAIPADRRMIGAHPFHLVGEKYALALIDGAGTLPLFVPSLGARLDFETLLGAVDGLLLTGSPSNVEPHHYAGPASEPGTWHDPARDATTLPLVRRAVEAGIPVLGICRGFQEMNVAFGGSLHQKVHEVAGFLDHRDDESLPLEIQYAPVHEVTLEPGGLLERLAGPATGPRVRVNSLHSQGIDRLGRGLAVEARAPDGLIEAIRVIEAARFALAVQWHPEWQFAAHSLSRSIFAAFGAAARDRAAARRQHGSTHGE